MMKLNKLLLTLLLLAYFTQSCKNNSENQSKEAFTEVENLREDLPFDPRKAVFLQSFYATSTAEDSKLHFLLDDQPETYWQSKIGTGPDEGIMLRFSAESRSYVEKLKISFPKEDQLAQIRELILYVNDQTLVYQPETEYLEIDAVVGELYIRIADTEKTSLNESSDKDHYQSTATFSSAHAVGIAELQFFGSEGEALKIITPKVVKGQLMPSSNLNPVVAYHAGYLFDGKPDFAWIGGAEGSGREDSISFRLEKPVTITDLQLWNGYQASRQHFESNARVKRFSFGRLGEATQIYTLEDKMTGQATRLDEPLEGQDFVLKILDIYPGFSYGDLAISELLFFEGDQPISVESDLPLQFQEEYLSRISGTVLENLLDRRVYSEAETEEDVFQHQALILRSDGTFLSYQKEFLITYDHPSETFTEGIWQILEADRNGARVRVIGKMKMLPSPEKENLNAKEETFSRMFDEVINIFPDRIEGDRFLGIYYLE